MSREAASLRCGRAEIRVMVMTPQLRYFRWSSSRPRGAKVCGLRQHVCAEDWSRHQGVTFERGAPRSA